MADRARGCRCLAEGSSSATAAPARGRCGHITRRLCVFYLVDGMQGATATPANSCKEFAHLGSLVHAGALSTRSSTPANYHLSRATSLRNQFLPPAKWRGGAAREARRPPPRPEFQNFSGFPLLPLFPERVYHSTPPFPSSLRSPPFSTRRVAPLDERPTGCKGRRTSREVSPSGLYQIKLPPLPLRRSTNFQLIISALTHRKNVA